MKKNVFWGIILVLLAAYLIASSVMKPALPFFTIVASVVVLWIFVEGIRKKNVGEVVIALGFAYIIYDEYLPVPHISTWIIILATLLLAAGFSMIFKSNHVGIQTDFNGINSEEYVDGVQHSERAFSSDANGNYEGERLHFENGFASASKYVNSKCLRELHADNSFGSMNIYMDNAVLAPEGARVKVENAFGETKLYLPAKCKITTKEDTGLGAINYVGTPSGTDTDPVLYLDLDVSFGSIVVYYK